MILKFFSLAEILEKSIPTLPIWPTLYTLISVWHPLALHFPFHNLFDHHLHLINPLFISHQTLIFHEWTLTIESTVSGQNASLLVLHPRTKKLFVNFDPRISELLREAQTLSKMGLPLNDAVRGVCRKKALLRQHHDQ